METEDQSAGETVQPTPLRDSRNGRFLPGGPGGPGRGKTGTTFMERYKAKVEREADSILDAHMKRLKSDRAVGERAFVTMRDTLFGVPEQKLRIENDDSPGAQFLKELVEIAQRHQIPGTKTIEDTDAAS